MALPVLVERVLVASPAGRRAFVELRYDRWHFDWVFPQSTSGHLVWRPKGVELTAFRAMALAQEWPYS